MIGTRVNIGSTPLSNTTTTCPLGIFINYRNHFFILGADPSQTLMTQNSSCSNFIKHSNPFLKMGGLLCTLGAPPGYSNHWSVVISNQKDGPGLITSILQYSLIHPLCH